MLVDCHNDFKTNTTIYESQLRFVIGGKKSVTTTNNCRLLATILTASNMNHAYNKSVNKKKERVLK